MLVIVTAVAPLLERVTVCAALVVPTVCLSKIRSEVERSRPTASPVPERVTTGALPRASLVIATPAVR